MYLTWHSLDDVWRSRWSDLALSLNVKMAWPCLLTCRQMDTRLLLLVILTESRRGKAPPHLHVCVYKTRSELWLFYLSNSGCVSSAVSWTRRTLSSHNILAASSSQAGLAGVVSEHSLITHNHRYHVTATAAAAAATTIATTTTTTTTTTATVTAAAAVLVAIWTVRIEAQWPFFWQCHCLNDVWFSDKNNEIYSETKIKHTANMVQ